MAVGGEAAAGSKGEVGGGVAVGGKDWWWGSCLG